MAKETQPHHPDPQELLDIADKVRTGEYFQESQAMYDLMVHDPMAERYFYIVLTGIAVFVLLIALVAMQGLHPLKTEVPFTVASNNLADDVPRIRSLLAEKGEDPGEALLRFLVRNYVQAYEEYDINTFDRNIGTVKSQSAPEVFGEYQRLIDPKNPDSPLTLYQRHSIRSIRILSSTPYIEDDPTVEVVFEATVASKSDAKKTRWQADVTFTYGGLVLDEENGGVKPIEFSVTGYRTRRLQDVE
jgi:type IV secretory pathway component VirB8